MSPAKKHLRFDGYVRVPRVGGRVGESFISPRAQREAIGHLAALKGVKLGEIVDELDVSGRSRSS